MRFCLYPRAHVSVQLGNYDWMRKYFFPAWFAVGSVLFVALESRKQYRRYIFAKAVFMTWYLKNQWDENAGTLTPVFMGAKSCV